MDRLTASKKVGALFVVLACSLAACDSSSPAEPGASQTSSSSAPTPAVHRTSATLNCRHVIGTATTSGGRAVVLHRVALSTQRVLPSSPSGESAPGARRFAKDGLLIRPGVSFELLVPDAWVGRLSLGWGSPAPRVERLVVRRCAAPQSGARWLAFAGGYWVGSPACVPLVVKAGTQRRTVYISVGKRCRSA